MEGITNDEGIFCFERPAPGNLFLKLDAGPGHLGKFTLEAPKEGVTPTAVKKPDKDGTPLWKVFLGLGILFSIALIATKWSKKKAPSEKNKE